MITQTLTSHALTGRNTCLLGTGLITTLAIGQGTILHSAMVTIGVTNLSRTTLNLTDCTGNVMKIFYHRESYLMFCIKGGTLVPYWSGGTPHKPAFSIGKAINYFKGLK